MDTVIKMNPPDGVTSGRFYISHELTMKTVNFYYFLILVEVQNESMLVSLKALLSRVDIILEEISRMESGKSEE